MAFTFPLTFNWLKHQSLAAKRIINNLPVDYFVETGNKKSADLGKKLSVLPDLCHICGFSMAELILDNGWSIRACSATGFKDILNDANVCSGKFCEPSNNSGH